MAEIIEKELSYRIQGALMQVHRTLGPGFREETYRQALIRELAACDIPFESEKTISISYRGEPIDDYRLDFLIEGRVILELKAVAEMHPRFEAQLLSYLKAARLKLGYLVNFGAPELLMKRYINPHL